MGVAAPPTINCGNIISLVGSSDIGWWSLHHPMSTLYLLIKVCYHSNKFRWWVEWPHPFMTSYIASFKI